MVSGEPVPYARTVLRVGVIGYGHWGPNYARILRAAAAARLVVVCDRSADRCASAAGDHPDATIVDRAEDVFALGRAGALDAVVIATPAETHAALGLAALDAGLHTLIEKPLGMDVLEVEALVAAAAAAGRTLMVDHTYLYSDAVAELVRVVDGGTLGEAFSYRSVRTNRGGVPGTVGVARDLAVHDLAILDRLHDDEPHTVRAVHAGDGSVDHAADVVRLELAYPDGSSAHITVGWGTEERARLVVLESADATVVYDDLAVGAVVRVLPGLDGSAARWPELAHDPDADRSVEPPTADREPLRRAVVHFLEAVTTGTTPATDAASALRLARVLDGAQRSLDAGGIDVALGELEPLP